MWVGRFLSFFSIMSNRLGSDFVVVVSIVFCYVYYIIVLLLENVCNFIKNSMEASMHKCIGSKNNGV
jgi:hypothetical protein